VKFTPEAHGNSAIYETNRYRQTSQIYARVIQPSCLKAAVIGVSQYELVERSPRMEQHF